MCLLFLRNSKKATLVAAEQVGGNGQRRVRDIGGRQPGLHRAGG